MTKSKITAHERYRPTKKQLEIGEKFMVCGFVSGRTVRMLEATQKLAHPKFRESVLETLIYLGAVSMTTARVMFDGNDKRARAAAALAKRAATGRARAVKRAMKKSVSAPGARARPRKPRRSK